MHAGQVETLIRVSDEVPESRGADQAICEWCFDDSGSLQSSERVGIVLRRARAMCHAGRDSEINDSLGCLPQMENDDVSSVITGSEFSRARRQFFRHPRQMPLERECPLGQNRAIERAHLGSVSRT